jgi:Lipocalin-like domain
VTTDKHSVISHTFLRTIGSRVLTFAVIVVSVGLTSNQGVAQVLRQQVVGTWTLVSNKNVLANGSKEDTFGSSPIGTASFDDHGRFSVIIMRSDLPKIASNNRMTATAEENKAILQGGIAYFGSYSISESDKSLIFHVEGATFPNWVGTTQKRLITNLSLDELTLINPAASTGATAEIQWKRVK